jgi:hypothetical protein
MLGIQGFKTCFVGGYLCEPDKWMWHNGILEIDEKHYEFSGGHPPKPPQCIIEEYEETPETKTPTKKLRAICSETGKEV